VSGSGILEQIYQPERILPQVLLILRRDLEHGAKQSERSIPIHHRQLGKNLIERGEIWKHRTVQDEVDELVGSRLRLGRPLLRLLCVCKVVIRDHDRLMLGTGLNSVIDGGELEISCLNLLLLFVLLDVVLAEESIRSGPLLRKVRHLDERMAQRLLFFNLLRTDLVANIGLRCEEICSHLIVFRLWFQPRNLLWLRLDLLDF